MRVAYARRQAILAAISGCLVTAGLPSYFIGEPAFAAETKPASTVKEARLNNEGVTALQRNDFTTAEKKFKDALAVNPKYRYATDNYAILLNNQALLLVKVDRDSAWRKFHLANYLQGSNQTTLQNMDAMLTEQGLNPNSFDERMKQAGLASQSGDVITAIVEYEAALALHEDPVARKKLASLKPPSGTPHRLSELKPYPKQGDNGEYAAWMDGVENRIRKLWKPNKTEVNTHTALLFKVHRDGHVSDISVKTTSGDKTRDTTAIAALKAGAPYGGMPTTDKRENVEVLFTFDYNAWEKSRNAQIAAAQERFHKLDTAGEKAAANALIALNDLAKLYTRLGMHKEAQETFADAEKRIGAKPEFAGFASVVLASKAKDLYDQGKFADAESLLKKAFEGFEKNRAENKVQRIEAMELYAKVLYKQSRAQEADKYYVMLRKEKAGP